MLGQLWSSSCCNFPWTSPWVFSTEACRQASEVATWLLGNCIVYHCHWATQNWLSKDSNIKVYLLTKDWNRNPNLQPKPRTLLRRLRWMSHVHRYHTFHQHRRQIYRSDHHHSCIVLIIWRSSSSIILIQYVSDSKSSKVCPSWFLFRSTRSFSSSPPLKKQQGI